MVERSQPPCPEPPWLLRHGVRVRRVLGGFLLALPVVVFVTGIPQSEAGVWFFLCGAGALEPIRLTPELLAFWPLIGVNRMGSKSRRSSQ
jgi:hypothetical protein